MLLSSPVVLLGGKGGVGKTTLATAYAGLLARRGERTLLVSTDPAHNTSDLLDAPIGPEPVPVPPHGDLEAVELDPEREAERYVERIRREAERVVSREVLPAVERHLALALHAPGTVEAALLDRLIDVLGWCPERYDRIVVDTAPTGHTLRLLALPTVLGPWLDSLVHQRKRVADADRMIRSISRNDAPAPDDVADRVAARRDSLRRAKERLIADAIFHLVCVPERLPVAETLRTEAALRLAGMSLGAILVNRLVPRSDDPFLSARADEQDRRLAELRTATELPLVTLPHLPHDAVSPADVSLLGERLRAAGL